MPARKGLLCPQNNFLDTIAKRFDGTHSNFVLGNAKIPSFPIVYCSDGFLDLTGYSRARVMSQDCSCVFLAGEQTPPVDMQMIQTSLHTYKESKTEIILYKQDGSFFWGLVDTIPIKNETGDVVLFLVSCKDITKEKLSTDDFGDSKKRARKGSFQKARRRSRQILYNISSHLSKPKINFNNKIQKISGKNAAPEYKVQEVSKARFIILHYGVFKIIWDWLILLCTFYVAIMVPYNAAFLNSYVVTSASEPTSSKRISLVPDVIVEVLFIVDMVLNFRTTFVSKSGKVIYNGRTVALNYIKSWFFLDLLAAAPFDLLYAFNVKTNSVIPLLKISRLLRLARLLQKIDRYSQYSGVVLTLLMSFFALVAHWLACIWYVIGHAEAVTNHGNDWKAGWLYTLSVHLFTPTNRTHDGESFVFQDQPDSMSYYVTALYYTTSSLTSVGFGNVSANTDIEKIFSVISMLIGALMHAVVFGNVTAIIQRLYARRASYHSKTRDLKDFWRTYRIPKSLKTRMQEFFQTMWSMNNGIDIKDITKDFPEELRSDIAMHLHKEILALPIFGSASKGCLKMVSLQVKTTFCSPREPVLHEGDALSYLYYICSGSVEILKDGQVVAIMGKGDVFGHDISEEEFEDIACPVKCSYDVRGMTYCDMQCLSIQGLKEVLQHYPEYAITFVEQILQELTFNLKQDEHHCGDGEPMPSIAECEGIIPNMDCDDVSETEMTLLQSSSGIVSSNAIRVNLTPDSAVGGGDQHSKESVTNSYSYPTMNGSPRHAATGMRSASAAFSSSFHSVGRKSPPPAKGAGVAFNRRSVRPGSRKMGSIGHFQQSVNDSIGALRQDFLTIRLEVHNMDEKVTKLHRGLEDTTRGLRDVVNSVNSLVNIFNSRFHPPPIAHTPVSPSMSGLRGAGETGLPSNAPLSVREAFTVAPNILMDSGLVSDVASCSPAGPCENVPSGRLVVRGCVDGDSRSNPTAVENPAFDDVFLTSEIQQQPSSLSPDSFVNSSDPNHSYTGNSGDIRGYSSAVGRASLTSGSPNGSLMSHGTGESGVEKDFLGMGLTPPPSRKANSTSTGWPQPPSVQSPSNATVDMFEMDVVSPSTGQQRDAIGADPSPV